MSAPAARPNPNPGPLPRPRSSAGAVTVVAATVATVARIANAFFMRMSSLEYPRTNADTFKWLQGEPGFWCGRGGLTQTRNMSRIGLSKEKKDGAPKKSGFSRNEPGASKLSRQVQQPRKG